MRILNNRVSSCVLSFSLGIGLLSQPVQAQGTTFVCRSIDNVPTTVAETSRGSVSVIRWASHYFTGSGWTPEARCQEVSQRFQTYHQAGSMNYLTTGRMNRQPVICTSDRQGGACQNLLFTLKHTSNPGRTLQELMEVRVQAAGPLNETTSQVYINLNDFLDTSPLLDEPSSESSNFNEVSPQTLEPADVHNGDGSNPESIW